ncbi:MAG: hypothetical protein EA349_06830 [Halomonadaceae bacterium]|nr:MAG: hypothetical protein EA349_06830 [Halomonadaceae bacterium]
MKKLLLATSLMVITVGIGAVIYTYHQHQKTVYTPLELTREAPTETAATSALAAADSQAAPASNLASELAIKYLELYGDTIDQPATQAKLLHELEQLLTFYPESGYSVFADAVALAFPDLKDPILSLVSRLKLYYQWKEDNLRALQAMVNMERQGALWEKREEMFGEKAHLIWAEEGEQLSQKQQAISQKLERLDQAFEITPDETVYQLQTTINEIYGQRFAREVIGIDALSTTLFSLESIQAHLQSLPAEERQATINSLRKQLGYDEAALARMEAMDQERNKRWETGNEYMSEREQLTLRFSGEQLERELESLREKHFGRSAETISREEDEGFYRFKRGRRFGLN